MSDSDADLIVQLLAAGFEVGKSKTDKLLRVDNRNSGASMPPVLFEKVLQSNTIREVYLRGSSGILNQNIDGLCALPRLQVLDLENSDLNNDSLQRLASMTSLQVLNVRGTRITGEQIALTRKSMIGTRIIG